MIRFIQTVAGQGDKAEQAVFEQDVEAHEANGTVLVNQVQLRPKRSKPEAARMRLIERRRRRAGRRS